MTEPRRYGRTDEELASLPLNFRADLFAGKSVLVSGAGSGIGKATAFWFARLGAKVALTGRKPDKLEATAAALRALGAEVLVAPGSIRSPEDVERVIDETTAHPERGVPYARYRGAASPAGAKAGEAGGGDKKP